MTGRCLAGKLAGVSVSEAYDKIIVAEDNPEPVIYDRDGSRTNERNIMEQTVEDLKQALEKKQFELGVAAGRNAALEDELEELALSLNGCRRDEVGLMAERIFHATVASTHPDGLEAHVARCRKLALVLYGEEPATEEK